MVFRSPNLHAGNVKNGTNCMMRLCNKLFQRCFQKTVERTVIYSCKVSVPEPIQLVTSLEETPRQDQMQPLCINYTRREKYTPPLQIRLQRKYVNCISILADNSCQAGLLRVWLRSR